jgi:hypothetical protein
MAFRLPQRLRTCSADDNFAEPLSVAASSLPMSDLANRATAPLIHNQKMSRILRKSNPALR